MAAGTIYRLQTVMIAAVRLVTDTGRYEHNTPVIREVLHWLPVQQRIIFKIAVFALNCIRGTGPGYINCVELLADSWQTSLGDPVYELLIVVTFLCHQLRPRSVVDVSGLQRLLYGTHFPFGLHLRGQTISKRLFRSGLKITYFNYVLRVTLVL